MANGIVERLWRWSDEGELPTVIDASSCAHALLDEVSPVLSDANRERHGRLEVMDAIAWGRERLVPQLEIRRRLGSVAVHPTCGGRHIGLDRPLRALAGELAHDVHVPPSATCCGFAGDRGFLHPELTQAATREEAAEVGVEELRRLRLEQPNVRDRPRARDGRAVRARRPAFGGADPLTDAGGAVIAQERSTRVETTAS